MTLVDDVVGAVQKRVDELSLPALSELEVANLARLVRPELEFLTRVDPADVDDAIALGADIVLGKAALQAVSNADAADAEIKATLRLALTVAASAARSGAII